MKLYPTTSSSQGKWIFFIGVGLLAVVLMSNWGRIKGMLGSGAKTEEDDS